jgi:RsiW-degrading membrane proteinase PrsW (M82 family)
MDSNIIFYLILAVLPGLIWLFYYLKKDVLPEPKMQIIKVFICGFLVCIPVVIFELFLLTELKTLNLPEKTYLIVKGIFVIALVEEMFKYAAARYSVMKSSHIDEPIDIPIYMIIAALGFATAENIIVFCNQKFLFLSDPLILAVGRFISSTLLHALASGIIGMFLARAFYCPRQRYYLIPSGFILAILTHAFFNFFMESSIIKETTGEWGNSILYSLFIVFILFVTLSFLLKQIKKLKGVCKI